MNQKTCWNDFFIKNKNDCFEIKDECLVLKKSCFDKLKFKKIGGSSIATALGMNEYSTPFKCWLGLTNLYKEEMDFKLALAGETIEPKIIDFVSKKMNHQYKQNLLSECYGDVFKTNKVFCGMPDGEPINAHGNVDYSDGFPLLEIKTCGADKFLYKKNNSGGLELQTDSNNRPIVKEKNKGKEKWFSNSQIHPPENYVLQLGLYLYLRNINYGMLCVAFLQPNDYVNPSTFDPTIGDVHLIEVHMNEKFKEIIKNAETWYKNHVLTGISPKMTNEDYSWLKEQLGI